MEDKYGGCMREMDSLIDQFRAQIIFKDKDPSETSTTIKGKEVSCTFIAQCTRIKGEGDNYNNNIMCAKCVCVCVCLREYDVRVSRSLVSCP